MNLRLENCRGQCYDGASNMKGSNSGVETLLLKDEPRAIYTHCYGHALYLACSLLSMLCSVNIVKNTLDNTYKLSKLLKYSAKKVPYL